MNVLQLQSAAVLTTAEELGLLPSELNQSIDNPNRLSWYVPKEGAEPDSSGVYREEDMQVNPAVLENVERVLPDWRGSAEYARACKAAYELDGRN